MASQRFVEVDSKGRFLDKGHKKEIAGLLICGFSIFVLLAMASYTWGAEKSGNICGVFGDRVSFLFHMLFGKASFALFVYLAVWGGLLTIRKDGGKVFPKIFGIIFFTCILSILFSLNLDIQNPFLSATNTQPFGPGGVIGAYIGPRINMAFGPLGSYMILFLLLFVSLLLATDFLFLEALRRRVSGEKAQAEEEESLIRKIVYSFFMLYAFGKKLWNKGQEWFSPKDEAPSIEIVDKNQETVLFKEEEKKEKKRRSKSKRKPKEKIEGEEKEERKTVKWNEKPTKIGKYKLPPITLLKEPVRTVTVGEDVLEEMSKKIERKLASFKIEAKVVSVSKGPAVTLFELNLAEGVKVNQISARDDDLAMALAAQSLRVVAPIPGKGTVGVEVPNDVREMVVLRDLLPYVNPKSKKPWLPLFLGRDVMGEPVISDLAEMPHLLIAGATGSGKSVCLNAILISLLMTRTPDEVGFILVDPKTVELQAYEEIPHLMAPIVTESSKVPRVLQWAVDEMERRYKFLAMARVRKLSEYNSLGEKKLKERMGSYFDSGDTPTPRSFPSVVIVIDEFGDLMSTVAKEIEGYIIRLAQKSRAVGLHVIMSTQHPSKEVVTGIIKANLPTRISFKVTSQIYSRVILDQVGAEKLIGNGDMLFIPPGTSSLLRAQGTFVSEKGIQAVVDFWKAQAEPQFVPELLKSSESQEDFGEADELYEEAVRIVLSEKRGAATLLQRMLKIGYTRASRLIELMEKDGIVGKYAGSKSREVLITLEEWENRKKEKKKIS